MKKWGDFIIYKDYIFLKKLASGGMARVFLASKKGIHGFEKFFAIKQVHDHLLENEGFSSMFVGEAKLSSKLEHPNIVKIIDLIKEENHFLMVMEYIRGKNLRDVLKKASQTRTFLNHMSLKITSEMLKGLHYAHNLRDISGKEQNIIHRDISPQNIMISYEGEIKITDFGIAKAADNMEETRTGVLKGKVSYMSPEQASGSKVTQTSDLFSVGIMFYEMLLLKKCFNAEDAYKTIEKVKNCEYVPIDKVNPNLHPELKRIVNKALAKDLDERYTTAQEFQAEIDDFIYTNHLKQSEIDVCHFMQDLFKEEKSQEITELAKLYKDMKKIPYAADEETARKTVVHPKRSEPSSFYSDDETYAKPTKKVRRTTNKRRVKPLKIIFHILLMLLIPLLLFDLLFYDHFKDFVSSFSKDEKIVNVLTYRPVFLPVINLLPYYRYTPVDVGRYSRPVKFIFSINRDDFSVFDKNKGVEFASIKEESNYYSIVIPSHINNKIGFNSLGYKEYELDLNIKKTNTLPHSIIMEELVTVYHISWEPENALLYINDKFIARNSPHKYTFNPESDTVANTIKVMKEGWETFQKTIFSGRNETFSVSLKPELVNVKFTLVPWGRIYQNGKLIGECQTGSHVTIRLPSGSQTFTFSYPDTDEKQDMTLNISPENSSYTVTFKILDTKVQITSYPPEASIYVDQALMGTTPVTLNIKSGYRKIVVFKNNYESCEYDITLNAGEFYQLHCELILIE